MLDAMEWNDQEPILIEDLIKIGEDDGFEKGQQCTLRSALRTVLDARGIPLDEAQRARIEAEVDVARLSAWMRRAVLAKDSASVFADE